jgi:hypothetical protein
MDLENKENKEIKDSNTAIFRNNSLMNQMKSSLTILRKNPRISISKLINIPYNLNNNLKKEQEIDLENRYNLDNNNNNINKINNDILYRGKQSFKYFDDKNNFNKYIDPKFKEAKDKLNLRKNSNTPSTASKDNFSNISNINNNNNNNSGNLFDRKKYAISPISFNDKEKLNNNSNILDLKFKIKSNYTNIQLPQIINNNNNEYRKININSPLRKNKIDLDKSISSEFKKLNFDNKDNNNRYILNSKDKVSKHFNLYKFF